MQGARYSLSQQMVNLERTLSQLRTMMSPQAYTDYLARSLVVLVFGSNDYINNYLMPNLYFSSFRYRPPEFANMLLSQYARQLMVCYIKFSYDTIFLINLMIIFRIYV